MTFTDKVSILLVDDDAPYRMVLSRELARRGYVLSTAGSGEEALRIACEADFSVILLDLRLPEMDGLEALRELKGQPCRSEVIVLTGHGTIDTAIEAMRLGAFDYVSKPCPIDELELCIERACERKALRERNLLLERGLQPTGIGQSPVGSSSCFRDVVELAKRVAVTDSTVLIHGPTGAGKDVIARLIHACSPRSSRPFVVVECAALQESLLQSELFGHERGAFTGADRTKPGLFEVAEKGTIFLDEIGEVSLATQVKLLRVLDSSSFRRVGGTKEIQAKARVVAATNRDVPKLVAQGLFREDLYYRISTVSIKVPPLHERPEDIVALSEHYVGLFRARFNVDRQIGRETLELLKRYRWPGNVRELIHALEHAMIVCDTQQIEPHHLPAALSAEASSSDGVKTTPAHSSDPLERLPTLVEVERAHIERVLRATGGLRQQAAQVLGISERSLYRKLEDHGLRKVGRNPEETS